MLRPSWGYVDQPPLVPFLARTLARLVDEPWLVRLIAVLCAAAALVVLALVAREVGGGRRAQLLAAGAVAGGTTTLVFGHVLLTSSVDLLVWPPACLLVLRAVLRDEQRWWLWTGVVVGLSTSSTWLVVLLLVSVAVRLLLTGRGRVLLSRGVVAGGLLAAVAAPGVARGPVPGRGPAGAPHARRGEPAVLPERAAGRARRDRLRAGRRARDPFTGVARRAGGGWC